MTDPKVPDEPTLNPAAIVGALNRHKVRYIVIGAFAAIAQRAPIPATRDIDITPDPSPLNLDRLSQALTDLGARIRTRPFLRACRSATTPHRWQARRCGT